MAAEALEEAGPSPSASSTREASAAAPAFVHRRASHGLVGPFGGRQILAGVLVVAAVALALIAVTAPLASTGAGALPDPRPTAYLIGPVAEGLKVGDRAPDFTLTRSDGSTFTLTDLEGNAVRLPELRGKAVWINFWASWCPPCQAETPVLRETAAKYRDRGLVVLGISVQESSAADVQTYVIRYSLGYRVAADLAGDIFHHYRVYALPTQFFIDADGRISSIVQGPLDVAGADAQVEAILPKGR